MEGIQLPHDVVFPRHTSLWSAAFKSDVLPVHPVEVIQRTASFCQYDQSIAGTDQAYPLEKAFGSAFLKKMDIERQILSRVQRPPGLVPSSMIGLESLTGELNEFGFEDFLNDPKESDTIIPVDMHEGMEVCFDCCRVITLSETLRTALCSRLLQACVCLVKCKPEMDVMPLQLFVTDGPGD